MAFYSGDRDWFLELRQSPVAAKIATGKEKGMRGIVHAKSDNNTE